MSEENTNKEEITESGSVEITNAPQGSLINFSPEKIKVLTNTVAKGATTDELEMFLHLASRYQLDPFAKEIWFVKRPKKVKDAHGNWDYKRLENGEVDYEGVDPIIMTSRDGYLKVAQSDAEFEGVNSFEIRANDDFSFNPMTGEIEHKISSKRGEITAAWAVCKRKGREPAIALVDFNEYKNAAGSNPVWKNYPSAMIRKVAEVIVLKRQFNISGLVTKEEMPEQYTMDYEDPNLKRIERQPVKQLPGDEVDAQWKQLSKQVKTLSDQLGLDKAQMENIALFELDLDVNPKEWSLSDLKKMIDYLEKQVEKYVGEEESNAE